MGVRIALDDFGTGYSSLAVVHGFPLDLVKIDKLFIRSGDKSLARAIIAMAGSLGLTAVAEGIEVPAQIDDLHAMGCELGQGFAFSHPVELSRITDLLQSPLGPRAHTAPVGAWIAEPMNRVAARVAD
jgi:EAL domain-containing protein (putative c-di-GMP-specific phosphodiesterase class I)